MGHGKSWKMPENNFPRTTKQEILQTNDRFHIILKTTSLFEVMENIKKVLGKVMESKVTEFYT